MTERITRTSRLRFSQLESVEGIVFWGLPVYPEIPVLGDERTHIVQDGDRLDALAQTYYGAAELQFVIANANLDLIEIWPSDLRAGQRLRIPSPSYVREKYPDLGTFR